MNAADGTDFIHTGPGTLAGRYLRSFWQPILLSEELLPERPLRVYVMGEWLTAYRGASGRAYVTEDRCPHRSTQLSLGWVEGDNLRCFYHGWMFGPEGRCVEQPAEGNNTLKDRIRILACPVREYMGMVFAYLGEGEAPEFPLLHGNRPRPGYGLLPAPRRAVQLLSAHRERPRRAGTSTLSIVSRPRRLGSTKFRNSRFRRRNTVSCAKVSGSTKARTSRAPDISSCPTS